MTLEGVRALDEKRKKALVDFIKRKELTSLEPLNLELIDQAFRHPSFVSEQKGTAVENNQRLEFLGDSVIGFLTAEYLYRKFPDRLEGDLTRMRSAVVCEAALVLAANKLELGPLLLLGKGERMSGGAARPSNLADCMEALVGAVFLSNGNANQISKFIVELLEESFDSAIRGDYGDYKSRLQEWIQREGNHRLSYHIVDESGPDHHKRFCAGVYLDGRELARDAGHSKQEAEQRAARSALTRLQEDSDLG